MSSKKIFYFEPLIYAIEKMENKPKQDMGRTRVRAKGKETRKVLKDPVMEAIRNGTHPNVRGKKKEKLQSEIKKPRRKAIRGEVASKNMLSMQFGKTNECKEQKAETMLRFQRRSNNVAKNIRSTHRIGKKSAIMIQCDRKEYISSLLARAVTFTYNRGKKQVQKRDIYSALEDPHNLHAIAPHMVRVGK
jgi:histone H3/H4